MKDDFIAKYAIEGTVHDFNVFGPTVFRRSELTDDMMAFMDAPWSAMALQWKSMANKKERGKYIILLSEIERNDGDIHYWFTQVLTEIFMLPKLDDFLKYVAFPISEDTCRVIKKAVDENRVKRYTAYCMESDINPDGYKGTMNFTQLTIDPLFFVPSLRTAGIRG